MITPTVLCVDDEVNILSSLKRLLRPTGYRVLIAESASMALELIEAENGRVNLVISDMRMPGMDGAQLLAKVRETWPEIMRILLTGYSDVESTIAAINDGQIYRYISKPWNDQELLLTVREALERQNLESEKARLEVLTTQQNQELRALNSDLEEKVQARTQELCLANEKLSKSFFTSVQVFANLIELRAGNIGGHSRRVADLARKICARMQLDAGTANNVVLAALLHDIGKIGFPDSLLGKPVNKMTHEEFEIYRKHPVKGEQALMALDELREAARLIRSHHERYDGKGFPDGHAGDQIPQGARILALANAFVGLQQRMPAAEAMQNIIHGRAKQYDPAVVDAFVAEMGGPQRIEIAEINLRTADLKAGMTLTRDLYSRDGVLLLAMDYTLTESLIRQIRDYEASERSQLSIYVRRTES
jgi:response regulator RpfG family c-di-GMP phosphodiesterase